jgi:hypothetical protein
MTKLFITLLNLSVILALQIFPGNVSVEMNVPAQVQAGSEFSVNLTLKKGDLDGFSRFQQSLPAGLTAISETSANADFTFGEKRVRLIWLRIPENNEITVSYRVKVDEKLKGTFQLDGRFSYIENNERKSVDVNPVAITIIPSPDMDPSLIVDINDFEKTTLPYPFPVSGGSSNIACIRQKPLAGSQGDYIVNILVSKESTRRFAKIEEDIPEGYTAVAITTKDAIFTFKEQRVKFLWMNLPLEPFFVVSYRLIPKNQAKLPAPEVKGAFSYLINDKTMSIDILERNLNVAEVNDNNISDMLAQAQTETISEPLVNTKETEKNTIKPAQKEQEKQIPASKQKPSTDASATLSPDNGVYYRIQLAAGHKPVNVERYFKRLNLGKEVYQESHEGWQKYSVGSFKVYKEARDYRIHIWNTTPVKDAFITAYNGGFRITVQEALMITEQKWYR